MMVGILDKQTCFFLHTTKKIMSGTESYRRGLRNPKPLNTKRGRNDINDLLNSIDYPDYDDYVSYDTKSGHDISRIPKAHYKPRKEEDIISKYRELQDISGSTGVFKGLDPSQFVDYVKVRGEEQEELQFEKYLLESVDPTNKYEVDRMYNLFPEIAQSRENTLKRQKEKYAQLIHMWIYGVSSDRDQGRKDMALGFKIDTGQEKFSGAVLEKLLGIDSVSTKVAENQYSLDGYPDDFKTQHLNQPWDENNSINLSRPLQIVNGKVQINRGNDKPSPKESIVKRLQRAHER
jgi:hypothetical protein